MEKKELIDNLIACECAQWNEEDREALDKMEEAVLNKMQPAEHEHKTETPLVDNVEPEENPDPTDVIEPVDNQEEDVTFEKLLGNAPAEYQEMFKRGMLAGAKEKQDLINTITNAKNNKFTEEQLKAKSIEDLEGIASLVSPVKEDVVADVLSIAKGNYLGNAGAPIEPVKDDDPLQAPKTEDAFPLYEKGGKK